MSKSASNEKFSPANRPDSQEILPGRMTRGRLRELGRSREKAKTQEMLDELEDRKARAFVWLQEEIDRLRDEPLPPYDIPRNDFPPYEIPRPNQR